MLISDANFCHYFYCRITTMNAVNAVLLFILVWTFSPVCQADDDDDDFSVSCDDVTGSVGKEVNLTCSVSLNNTECCITGYKFKYSEINNEAEICKKSPVNPCDQRNSFTCSYTPTTAMTEKFRFFVQTKCGSKNTEFTVVITESSLRKAKESEDTGEPGSKDTESNDTGSKGIVISSVVGCSIIIILIIILMTIICKKQSFGFQRRMFLCIKHDEDN
ncbi:uncharacterized protein LOC127158968, partial [Labeo rohita]|uniref:uncharacterized protein LOC127158968 n=1 Tax=Labeo rohita TaxID=84645 RepID=UPI0021E33187